jgi:hypothetical protein
MSTCHLAKSTFAKVDRDVLTQHLPPAPDTTNSAGVLDSQHSGLENSGGHPAPPQAPGRIHGTYVLVHAQLRYSY